MKVTFNYPRWVDVLAWERDHAAGARPDRWPYGIDHLDGQGLKLSYTDVCSLGRLARRVPYRYEFVPRERSSGDYSLYWDERSAVSALSRSKRDYRVGAGLIWLTDDGGTDLDARTAGQLLSRRIDFAWVLSEAQTAPAAQRLGLPLTKVHYLPFGVDTDFFAPGSVARRDPVVLSAGQDRDRDRDTLLTALASIGEAVPGVRLRYQDQAPASFHGAEPFSRLTHGELRDAYREASVVVIATRPNLHVSGMTVALEAMACGAPVVMTETPGAARYVDHGVTGFLVPPGDSQELARATRELLKDPAMAQAFGRAGRSHVLRQHTSELMCQRLTEILAIEA